MFLEVLKLRKKIEKELIKNLVRYNYGKKINSLIGNSDKITVDYKKSIGNYWSQYNQKFNINWHKWYSSRNKIEDVKYIPEDLYYSVIEPYFNNKNMKEAYTDKGYLKKYFQM